jgi:cysteine-rich repeat protein
VSGDGCDANCTLTRCGNDIVTAGEQCDDGNLVAGDGCSALCQHEIGIGSQVVATTSNVSTTVPVTARGTLRLQMGARDLGDRTAAISVPAPATLLPPAEVPGLGVLCLTQTATGTGVIDCDGGHAGANLTLQQVHGYDPANPGCTGGCVESPSSNTCSGPHVGVCRGPLRVMGNGAYIPGGAQLMVPVAFAISTSPGVDYTECTADDTYILSNVPVVLNLTTGTIHATIVGVDATLSSMTYTATGAPFDCVRVIGDDLGDAALVTTLSMLDVPYVNGGLKDLLLTYRLEALSEAVHGTCDPDICSVDADCRINPATDVQTCLNLSCVCDDDNLCNGTETTDPLTGVCSPGTPPNCDDGDPCTTDSCDPTLGCVYVNPCDDSDACNGVETCEPTTGACISGTPPNCDDGNICTSDSCNPATGCVHANPCSDNDACNGLETCDPGTGACSPGTPPNCDDGNVCTTDSCNAATGCVHVNNTDPCDDGTRCTINDVCQTGVCSGTEMPCDDGDLCNGVEVCDPTTGICNLGISLIGQEFLNCEFASLNVMLASTTDEVQLAQAEDLGGVRPQKSLLKYLVATQAKVTAAQTTTGRRLQARLRGLSRRLNRFSGTIQTGVLKSRIDPNLGEALVTAASGMVEVIDTLRQQVSVP